MPDCSYGEIQIGGKVPRSLLPALLAHLRQAGLVRDDATIDDLTVNESGVLAFEDDQAIGGEFNALEEFLKQNQLDFDRQAASSYYYDADDVDCRGGQVWSASLDAAHTLRRRLRDELLPLIDAGDLSGIRAFAERNGPPPALTPFTVIDE